jgi:nitrogen regulatory protein P-II 2
VVFAVPLLDKLKIDDVVGAIPVHLLAGIWGTWWFRCPTVREALTAIGIQGLTVSEVKGYGRQKGHTEIYRGTEYAVSFLPKLKIEIAIASDAVDKAVEAIATSAKTGQIGDGKIFVYSIDQAMRIRTGETDADAL